MPENLALSKYGVKIEGGWYDDTGHIYRNEVGTIVPSVTQVFSILGMIDFSAVPPETLAWKQKYGMAVHAALEFLIQADLDWDTLDEAIIAPVTGLEQWLKQRRYLPVASEEAKIVTLAGMQYGMRLDQRGSLIHLEKRRSVIVDLKTAAKEEATWKWQLGAYAAGFERVPLGWLGVMLKVDKDGIVKPYYYDLLAAQREFQILLAAAILKLNNGLAKVGQ